MTLKFPIRNIENDKSRTVLLYRDSGVFVQGNDNFQIQGQVTHP